MYILKRKIWNNVIKVEKINKNHYNAFFIPNSHKISTKNIYLQCRDFYLENNIPFQTSTHNLGGGGGDDF